MRTRIVRFLNTLTLSFLLVVVVSVSVRAASAQGGQPAPAMRGDGPAPTPKPFSITRVDPGLDAVVAPNTKGELLATGFELNEGPGMGSRGQVRIPGRQRADGQRDLQDGRRQDRVGVPRKGRLQRDGRRTYRQGRRAADAPTCSSSGRAARASTRRAASCGAPTTTAPSCAWRRTEAGRWCRRDRTASGSAARTTSP